MDKPTSCPKCGASAVDICQITNEKDDDCVRS